MNTVRMSTKKKKKNHPENTENIRKYQIEATELRNTITLKNILENFYSRLDEAEEKMRELEDKPMKLI